MALAPLFIFLYRTQGGLSVTISGSELQIYVVLYLVCRVINIAYQCF